MKKFLLFSVFVFCFTSCGYAKESVKNYVNIQDNEQIIYDIPANAWVTQDASQNSITLEKKVFEGTNDYSEYFFLDERRAFALSNGYEFIKDGNLICVDNNNLKFTKIIYEDETFKEVPLEDGELNKIFLGSEIVQVSNIKGNKIFIKKVPFKKKTILIDNDTSRSFYKFQSMPKFVHKGEIKALIPVHIGIYKFKHYGARKGRLYIYVI